MSETTYHPTDFYPVSNLLQRQNPLENLARFYRVSLKLSLFGDVTLERNWGRLGTNGRFRQATFPSRGAAEVARARILAAKLRRGYRPLVFLAE